MSQHQFQVDLYTRGNDGCWIPRDFTALTHSVPLTSLDCTLDLPEADDKVEFVVIGDAVIGDRP